MLSSCRHLEELSIRGNGAIAKKPTTWCRLLSHASDKLTLLDGKEIRESERHFAVSLHLKKLRESQKRLRVAKQAAPA